MLMSELIIKKRDGGELTKEEIDFMIDGYTQGEIPDYQMSAMLMAIFFEGMTHRETTDLTLAMRDSGDVIDLSAVSGIKADKHSTGGVGDKTSLVLCPMVAAQGVKMAKMSGRGLGHTGGTIDKLESIPGFSCDMDMEKFLKNVDNVGFAIAGQTANLVPADKKLYALRDVTGTVNSRPLIVSSIMSKKLAAGADVIVLDVKTGSGSFMKSDEDAFALAGEMVEVGNAAGKRTIAVVTDMDQPLGSAVGNALEVKEAIAVLRGDFAGELLELCLELGANILIGAGKADSRDEAKTILQQSIEDGSALKKLAEFFEAQGGNPNVVHDVSLLPQAPVVVNALATNKGYVTGIAADGIGMTSLHLGGGRVTKESVIDLSVGLLMKKKVGDAVEEGDVLAEIHAASEEKAQEAIKMLQKCYTISREAPEAKPFIRGTLA